MNRHLPVGFWLRVFVALLGLAALIQIWAGPETWHKRSWPLTIVTITLAVPFILRPQLIKRLQPSVVKLPFLEVTFVNPYQPSQETEQADSDETTGTPGGDEEARWVAAQLKIQWKLSYLIKHTIPAYENARKPEQIPHVAFATIGSLQYDEYLDAAEAERLNFILSCPWALVAAQRAARRDELLTVAENLAQTVRAKVLKRMVVKDLKAASVHLSIEDEAASGKFQVRFPSGHLTEVWPTWGRPGQSLVQGRLSKLAAGAGGGIVVTPFRVSAARAAELAADGVQLVSLADLAKVLSTVGGLAR